MSRLRTAFEQGTFVVTGEVAPPHGTDIASVLEGVEVVREYCHAINVTDNQGATLHMAPLAACHLLVHAGLEPIFQTTCRDRNRLALQSDLLAAHALGIEDVLILTGDDPRNGDHPESKGVFDIDSTQLLAVAKGLNEGVDMQGQPLSGPTDFLLGAAMFPEATPWGVQLDRTLAKIDAGARYFQTQAVMDTDAYARAVQDVRDQDPLRNDGGVKIVAGILLLKGPRMVKFINERLAGMMITDAVAKRIEAAENPMQEGIDIAAEQIAALKDVVDGVHIMTLGADHTVPEILSKAGVI